MPALTLKDVSKTYPGGSVALTDVSLEVAEGDFFVVFGISGCGKSTLLRIISGLEEGEGAVALDGERIDGLPTKQRDVAMFFQNSAINPQQTVEENLGSGLRLRKVPEEIIEERVKVMAGILGLEALLAKKPKALTVEQRLLLAIGRAVVREPAVFLLDEPFSNVEETVRLKMISALAGLQARLKCTIVYATSDRREAMSLGKRIAVLREGFLQQTGTPEELYDSPVNVYVADLLSGMQFVRGKLTKDGTFCCEAFTLPLPEQALGRISAPEAYLGTDRAVIAGYHEEDCTEGVPAAERLSLFDGETELTLARAERLPLPLAEMNERRSRKAHRRR